MNKNPSFAGSFYPDNQNELNNILNTSKGKYIANYKSKAIIVPHAGIYYSGFGAMRGFMHLEYNENIFIIAPSHHHNFDNIALPEYTYFDTPLGSLEVNNRLIKEINQKFPSVISNEPFEDEHAIEVQLPFIQNLFCNQVLNAIDFVKGLKKIGKKPKIVPILVGNCNYKLISDLISEFQENSSFVISSDLSHFYPKNDCRQIDLYTAALIETGKTDLFQQGQACGLTGIMGLVDYANKNNYSMIRTMLYNSGDISNDTDRVVGYGSWFMYEGKKNDYLEKFYSKYIISIAKASILAGLNEENFVPDNIPTVLEQYGACFITIKLGDKLRGCIGSIYPTRPLIEDIMDNAKNAAFQDSRFFPLTMKEFEHINISVSILSEIERINFKDEKDLLSKIYPYGIIIQEYSHRAVYLPVVWEQLPEREIFLNSLKEKAGLPSGYFSKTFEAYKFDTIYIEEDAN